MRVIERRGATRLLPMLRFATTRHGRRAVDACLAAGRSAVGLTATTADREAARERATSTSAPLRMWD